RPSRVPTRTRTPRAVKAADAASPSAAQPEPSAAVQDASQAANVPAVEPEGAIASPAQSPAVVEPAGSLAVEEPAGPLAVEEAAPVEGAQPEPSAQPKTEGSA
ncbi:MAG TPA: hypothetical protein VN860_02425, partial [Candidatus Acidoferrales bacterium]|nr:hypothetical protein [Candidatus Acidoferrales bacterium]